MSEKRRNVRRPSTIIKDLMEMGFSFRMLDQADWRTVQVMLDNEWRFLDRVTLARIYTSLRDIGYTNNWGVKTAIIAYASGQWKPDWATD